MKHLMFRSGVAVAALSLIASGATVLSAQAQTSTESQVSTVSDAPPRGTYTKANWDEVMKASHLKPTMVLFTMKGCGMCNDQKPHLEKKYAADKGAWTLGDVDTIAEKELRTQYDAKYRPTLIMFKDGKELDRKVGFYGVKGFEAWVDYTVKHWNGGPDGAPVDPDEPPNAVGKPGTPGGGPAKPAPTPAPGRP